MLFSSRGEERGSSQSSYKNSSSCGLSLVSDTRMLLLEGGTKRGRTDREGDLERFKGEVFERQSKFHLSQPTGCTTTELNWNVGSVLTYLEDPGICIWYD